MLTIENPNVLDDYQKDPMRFANVNSVCLNLNKISIGDTETKSLLNLLSNLLNLSTISLTF